MKLYSAVSTAGFKVHICKLEHTVHTVCKVCNSAIGCQGGTKSLDLVKYCSQLSAQCTQCAIGCQGGRKSLDLVKYAAAAELLCKHCH